MKSTTFIRGGIFVCALACCTLFSSCGSDDDDSAKDFGNVSNVYPKNVFTGKLPAQVDGYQVNYDDQGRVISLVNSDGTVAFTYNDGTRVSAKEWDVKMKDNDDNIFYIRLNKTGFAGDVLETGEDGTDTWKFTYNAQGQISSMYRSENEATWYVEYRNGDITKVTKKADDPQNSYTTTLVYTNAKYKDAIENKGCIMLFDDMYNIDMDEMWPAYYAGLLGRSTKHLPVGCKEDEDTYNYKWEFDGNGYPIFFSGDESQSYDGTYFTWK